MKTKVLSIVSAVVVAASTFLLAGCGDVPQATKDKVAATGSYVAQKAASIALQTVISAAVSPSDRDAKGNYLDSLATGLRQNAVAAVSSDDIRAIAKIWTPDKSHWDDLAGEIADLFTSTRGMPDDQRVELIAQGLNDAAAKARAMTAAGGATSG